jgi:hypothetical protein
MYSSVLWLRNICILAMVYELEHFRSRVNIHCFQVLHSTIFQNAISKIQVCVMYSSVLRLRNICILVMVYELEHFRSRGDIHCFQVLHSTIFQNAISATFCIVHLTNLMMFCVFIRISSLYCKFPDAWLIQMTLMF